MPRPSKELVDPRLAEDINISRREIAEGKGIPHAQVMHEMDDLIAAVDKIEEYEDLLVAEGEADRGEKISIEEFGLLEVFSGKPRLLSRIQLRQPKAARTPAVGVEFGSRGGAFH